LLNRPAGDSDLRRNYPISAGDMMVPERKAGNGEKADAGDA
jgi:hypothetical protein